MPEVFYTDNVAADKNILESYIPSLLDDVRAICIDKSTGNTILSNTVQLPLAVSLNQVSTELRDTVECADLTRLKQYVSETDGDLELGSYCFNRNAINSSRESLNDICSTILGLNLPKSNDVRLSNWEALELSFQQKQYVALDAYIAIAIYNSVKGMPLINELVTNNTQVGNFVGVFPRDSSKTIPASAFGYICSLDNDESYSTSLSDNVSVPSEKKWYGSCQFCDNNMIYEDNSATLDMFGNVQFLAYVKYKCLRTASEIVNLENNSASSSNLINDITALDNQHASFSSTAVPNSDSDNTPEKTTVPSRVLKDTFHLIEQIPISLRHGMAKDFKCRFRDCLFANSYLVKNSDFIWERVRRSIPPPNELANLVQNCFDTFANLECIKTGNPLFDKESLAASKTVMDQIKSGYVSDIVDGPPLYTEKGLDKNGLMRYVCSRATSSVEGSCRFNIIRKFSSFNAGQDLLMGSKNRHGIMHKSHYSPWLAQSIDALRFKVGHSARTESYYGNTLLGNTYSYCHTTEKFGITPIPSHVKSDHLMLCYDPNIYFQSNQLVDDTTTRGTAEKRILELSALPVVKLPNMCYASHQFIYLYLSKCQGSKYAVTAVHTPQEKALFDIMLDNSTDNLKYLYLRPNNRVVNFGLMAAAWSKLCSSDNYIYYKTPEHICSYNNILEDRRKYRDTVAHNIEASRSIRLVAQSKRRYKASVPSRKYRRLQSSTTTVANKINAGTFIEEGTILTPVNIAPRILDSGTSAQVTSSSQIDRRDNNRI
ncbi:hypothetical protein BDF21DRAFT_458905 [Thamnidium elegans]|nr:hypothetical protein BDF21DRAFT_458905 [Thamnidium elegans]